jgi:multidrug efflux pump subunit AcrB
MMGALLTGLMVLFFLRDWRSASLWSRRSHLHYWPLFVWLWALGQTINIMTLGGLALAVGVLVDEAHCGD